MYLHAFIAVKAERAFLLEVSISTSAPLECVWPRSTLALWTSSVSVSRGICDG